MDHDGDFHNPCKQKEIEGREEAGGIVTEAGPIRHEAQRRRRGQ